MENTSENFIHWLKTERRIHHSLERDDYYNGYNLDSIIVWSDINEFMWASTEKPSRFIKLKPIFSFDDGVNLVKSDFWTTRREKWIIKEWKKYLNSQKNQKVY